MRDFDDQYADWPADTRGRRQFDDDEPRFLKRSRRSSGRRDPRTGAPERDLPDPTDSELSYSKPTGSDPAGSAGSGLPEEGDRWSTWDQSAAGERGPQPYPRWLVTDLAAIDTELGIVKTGKEADVFLIRRHVPGTDRWCLLAAKRYRAAEHRLFHRDAGYLEGRRVKESRVNRAMAKRTDFGRQMISAQWAAAEFRALCHLWEVGESLGCPIVPYPAQIVGTELLLEFLGTPEGQAAPRLAQVRADRAELVDLWHQAIMAMTVLSRCGLAHGDLSPYNILVHQGRLVLIDLPQVLDVIANPRGPEFLARDVRNVARWFTARGLSDINEDEVIAELLAEAGTRPTHPE